MKNKSGSNDMKATITAMSMEKFENFAMKYGCILINKDGSEDWYLPGGEFSHRDRPKDGLVGGYGVVAFEPLPDGGCNMHMHPYRSREELERFVSGLAVADASCGGRK